MSHEEIINGEVPDDDDITCDCGVIVNKEIACTCILCGKQFCPFKECGKYNWRWTGFSVCVTCSDNPVGLELALKEMGESRELYNSIRLIIGSELDFLTGSKTTQTANVRGRIEVAQLI